MLRSHATASSGAGGPRRSRRPPSYRRPRSARLPRDHAMITALERRLAALERRHAASGRRRVVWWEEGMPKPQAEPGEQLTIISWMRSDEEPPEPPSTAWQERPPDGQAPPPGRCEGRQANRAEASGSSRANLHLASYDYPAVGAPPGSSAFKGRSRRPSASSFR